jgi:hypothetical protein
MQIVITPQDQILARYGNRLGALCDKAPVALARALNHEGAKGFTQVKRVLVKQTGIKYGMIGRAVKAKRATRVNLVYEIEATGNETNLNLFGPAQRKKGVSARPWNVRRIFPSTFIVKAYGGKVYKRTGAKRFPIKQLFGPNIAREIVKDDSRQAFEAITPKLVDRVGHEISFLMGA